MVPFIHPTAQVAKTAIVHDNVYVGEGAIIEDFVILGNPISTKAEEDSRFPNNSLVIGKNAHIRSHSVIYAASNFGDNFTTGHRVLIREHVQIGDNCLVGGNCDIQNDVQLGNYTRLHSSVIVGSKSRVGSFVFIYPFVVFTNDPYPPSNDLVGVTLGDYSQVAAGSVLLPGADVGQHCLVASMSKVSGTFEADSFISGNPAKRVGKLSKMPFFNKKGKRHYPWPNSFDRGMPWSI